MVNEHEGTRSVEQVAASADASAGVTKETLPTPGLGLRGETSALTIGRMLGLSTVTELSLLDSKIDLLTSKVNQLAVRMEKILGVLQGAPTGADLERIDVQIGAVKTAIVDFIAKVGPDETATSRDSRRSEASENSDAASTLRPGGKKVTFSSASE